MAWYFITHKNATEIVIVTCPSTSHSDLGVLVTNSEVREQFVHFDLAQLREREKMFIRQGLLEVDKIDRLVTREATEEIILPCPLLQKDGSTCPCAFNTHKQLAQHMQQQKHHTHGMMKQKKKSRQRK